MAWWDDAAEAVGSGLGWLGDAADAAVSTATEATEEVVDTGTEAVTDVLDAGRDAAAAASPALGSIVNVALGIVKGVVQAAHDAAVIVLDIGRNAGRLISDILHLNPAGIIGDLGNLLINVGQSVVWAIRVITGAYFGAAIADYFMRDRAFSFIQGLIIAQFGEKDGSEILRKLGFGSAHFGMPVAVSVRVMRADSNDFPFVQLQNAHVLDLFSLAGLLSFNSFRINRDRTRVVRVDDQGHDMWWLPITRFAIRSFLDSNGQTMRLRAYAMQPYAIGKAMRTAKAKHKKLCLDLNFDTPFNFPTFQTFPIQPCRNQTEFVFFDGSDGGLPDANWFAQNTPRDGTPNQDATPLVIGIFGFATPSLIGLTTGRNILRKVDGTGGCDGQSTEDACITEIFRHASDYKPPDTPDNLGLAPDAPCGAGCTWHDTYPPWFARLVLAHELGHYFGLAHAGHDGLENIMFSNAEKNAWVGGGSWRWWLYGDPTFIESDVENTWRFIVKKMPHVLRAL